MPTTMYCVLDDKERRRQQASLLAQGEMQVPVPEGADGPGVFILGSLERRVTIFAQQIRSLNLIAALQESEQSRGGSLKNRSICIVGAGAAGLTAAAAATQLDARVTLLEKQQHPLSFMSGNRSRWLHPRVADWPNFGWEAGDANLPLMHWRAAASWEVAVAIQKQWEMEKQKGTVTEHFGIGRTSLDGFDANTRQHHVRWDGAGGGGYFDYVILAVGFGTERTISGAPDVSYWDDDSLAAPVRSGNGRRKVLVLGTGDGGLIDLLRSRIYQFNHGTLIDDLFSFADSAILQSSIAELEDMFLSGAIDSRRLADRYRGMTGDAATHVRQTLSRQLRNDTDATIISTASSGLSISATPLHRFLACTLLEQDRAHTRHFEGEVSGIEEGLDRKFSVKGLPHVGGPFDRVVVRTGPVSRLKEDFPRVFSAFGSTRPRRRALPEPLWPANMFHDTSRSPSVVGVAIGEVPFDGRLFNTAEAGVNYMRSLVQASTKSIRHCSVTPPGQSRHGPGARNTFDEALIARLKQSRDELLFRCWTLAAAGDAIRHTRIRNLVNLQLDRCQVKAIDTRLQLPRLLNFIIVDDRSAVLVIHGSGAGHFIATDNQGVVEAFCQHFEAMWNHASSFAVDASNVAKFFAADS